MGILEAIGLGALQGATEFLPVSSSGHLTLAERALGMRMDAATLALDVMLHAATLCALGVYFGRAWAKRLRREPRLLALGSVACVPVVAAYFAGAPRAVELAKGSLVAMGAAFILAGGFVAFASLFTAGRPAGRVRQGTGRRGAEGEARGEGGCDSALLAERKRGFAQATLVGLAQAAALLPGVSRSGATIGTGLLAGLRREAAFEFSFLVGAPAILGAFVLEARDIGVIFAESPVAAVAGFAASFATGLGALALLREAVARRKLWAFGAYAAALGFVCLGLATGGKS